jgi:hypothetical protein
MQLSMFSSAEHHANPSPSRVSEADWMTSVATSCLRLWCYCSDIGPDGWSGRTSPASFRTMEDEVLQAFWDSSPDRRVEVPPGGWQSAGMLSTATRGAYGLAWRVLDSQFVRVDGFGRAVPQRRRRVFVVGYLGDWRRAAAVLFERESLSGNPPPRRSSGQSVAGGIVASSARRGGVSEGERGGLIGQRPEAAHTLEARPTRTRPRPTRSTLARTGRG